MISVKSARPGGRGSAQIEGCSPGSSLPPRRRRAVPDAGWGKGKGNRGKKPPRGRGPQQRASERGRPRTPQLSERHSSERGRGRRTAWAPPKRGLLTPTGGRAARGPPSREGSAGQGAPPLCPRCLPAPRPPAAAPVGQRGSDERVKRPPRKCPRPRHSLHRPPLSSSLPPTPAAARGDGGRQRGGRRVRLAGQGARGRLRRASLSLARARRS